MLGLGLWKEDAEIKKTDKLIALSPISYLGQMGHSRSTLREHLDRKTQLPFNVQQ